MKIACVPSKPLREILLSRELTVKEFGRMYSRRYTPDGDSTGTVGRLMNTPLIPVTAADKLAILLDSHPVLIWGKDAWDNPIYVEGGTRKSKGKVEA